MTAGQYSVDPAADEARPRGGRLPRRERRAQLLDSALEVFVAQGYHAAAMDDIADRAGVSKPVLYQHFPGKLDLYLALLDESCDTIISSAARALESTDDNKLRVTAAMVAEVIHEDTGLPDEAARLLAVSLVGMAQVSARFWLTEAGGITRSDAAALVAGLAWRGIAGYPLSDEPTP